MKILFLGDVVGKAGREVVLKYLPLLKEKYHIDFAVVNGENAAHGFGLTPKMFTALKNVGADVVTMGNHTFDKKDIFPVLESNPDIIRPMNYPEGTIGKGYTIYTLKDGRKILVAQVLGQTFMRQNASPVPCLEELYTKYRLGKDVEAIILDVHAEATSEKMAMGFLSDGKASLVVGTHTHIPTADAMILPQGTGYITDLGMCGDYYSIIGMTIQSALPRFRQEPPVRLSPAEDQGTLCGVFIETEDATGLCKKIEPVRVGAHLINCGMETSF